MTADGRTAGSAGGEHAERFTLLRPLLFTIVYEILGSATESDDVLQDSYLRWADVDLATVRDTKSYLAQLVTRQALNALRAGARRREDYIGPWLPEPLLLDERDASADVVLAESVSMAMLVLLETLSPDERAVFVLREVFGFDYDEIAGAVGKSVAAVRQVAHRAKEHVQARRKRFEPDDAASSAEIAEQLIQQLADRERGHAHRIDRQHQETAVLVEELAAIGEQRRDIFFEPPDFARRPPPELGRI